MRVYNNKLKYKNFCSVFVGNSGYVGPNIGCIDKSLYPFLVGYRHKICYLDIWASLGGLKDSFEVLCGVISNRGKVLVAGGDLPFVSILLCLKDSNVVVTSWDFSQIRNRLNLDLVLIHEVDNMSILESDSKYNPYIAVNGKHIKSVPYPCNISLKGPTISNWYLYSLLNSCRRGLYLRNKNFNAI